MELFDLGLLVTEIIEGIYNMDVNKPLWSGQAYTSTFTYRKKLEDIELSEKDVTYIIGLIREHYKDYYDTKIISYSFEVINSTSYKNNIKKIGNVLTIFEIEMFLKKRVRNEEKILSEEVFSHYRGIDSKPIALMDVEKAKLHSANARYWMDKEMDDSKLMYEAKMVIDCDIVPYIMDAVKKGKNSVKMSGPFTTEYAELIFANSLNILRYYGYEVIEYASSIAEFNIEVKW